MRDSFDRVLLARYLSDECSSKDRAIVDQWIASDETHQKTVQLLKKAWDNKVTEPGKSDIQQLWDGLEEKIKKSQSEPESDIEGPNRILVFPNRSMKILRVAAVLVLAVAAVSFLMFLGKLGPFGSSMHTIQVAFGEQQTIVLRDGSRVTLDSGSHFRYPKTFDENKREVFLSGEGYFDVASDANRPFSVQAGQALVKVVGTKFNVRAWQSDNTVHVAVAEGSVSLNSRSETDCDHVVISKGLGSSLSGDSDPEPPYPVDVDQHLGWMHKEAFFNNISIKDLLFQLERWYDFDFVLSDTSVFQEYVTVHINDDSEDEIIELISLLTDARVEKKGSTVYLISN